MSLRTPGRPADNGPPPPDLPANLTRLLPDRFPIACPAGHGPPRDRIRCRDAEDVRAVVADCAGRSVPMSVRGGGYSPAGLGEAADAVSIDVSMLDTIDIDIPARTVTIGGGVTAGDLDEALSGSGLALNLPVPNRIGVAGAALSGGVGVFLRHTGFIGDQIVAARLVDGNGTHVVATGDHHADLLWALRGGGGNFGVVTELTMACRPIPDFLVVQAAFPHERARGAMRLLRDFMADADDDITAAIFLRNLAGPATDRPGRPGVMALLTHVGDLGRAAADLSAVIDHPDALAVNASRVSPTELRRRTEPGFPFRTFGAHFRSGFADILTDDHIAGLVEVCRELPSEQSMVEVVPLGGAVRRGVGCAPGRDAAVMVNVMGLWTDTHRSAAVRAWVDAADDVLSDLRRDGAVVPGFLSRDEIDRAGATFGRAMADLRALKHRHDPQNLFAANLNIIPEENA